MSMTMEERAREWRCFHCDEVFVSRQCALLHFGRDEDSKPACQIKAGSERGLLGALRDAEYAAADARQDIANESTEAARAYYSQATRHHRALINAEELGYERGIADGRILAAEEVRREREACAAVAAERAKGREQLFNENGASINASKAVEAEEIAAEILARKEPTP